MDPRLPVLVGAGQVTRRPGERAPVAPLDLLTEAVRAAARDAGAPGLAARAGSVCVVDSLSWPAGDPGAVLAAELGAAPRETVRTGLGGDAPQVAVNDLAERIASGALDVAVLAGVECLHALTAARKAGEEPAWATGAPPGAPSRTLAPDRPGSSDAENAAGLIAPIFMYPLLEHALRAAAGRPEADHMAAVARLWASFAAEAARNPHAWTRDAPTAEQIATPGPANRLVSSPYTKLMNSNITVDQSAALLLCSVQAARDAGIPPDRWVFVHAGAEAHDHWFVTEREQLHRSPAIRLAGRAALAAAGVAAGDLAHVDLYSCFPSAVQIAAAELGLADRRPLTVTGGLTFAGGPGNDYATHGIATLAGRLREDPGALGLATALGWYATKHAIGIYGTAPPRGGFRRVTVQREVDALPRVAVDPAPAGRAAIESYTALYERDGSPGMGVVVARMPDGRRAAGRSHDPQALTWLLGDGDPLGRAVALRPDATFAPA